MDSINYSKTGIVFNIQRFSLHDGPGIRTIVFLKGCPLSCRWCSNPESQKREPVMMYNKEECLHCGKCKMVCKQGAIDPKNRFWIDRERCIGCGECANACPSGALVLKGKTMTVAQVMAELKKDASTYRRSEGGVTLSGGEPLVQYGFAAELLKACHAQGWNTAIETTGFATEKAVEEVIPHVDHVLMDVKNIRPDVHKKFTGVTNEVILKNAHRISEISGTVVRVPVIPGFNQSKEDILAIALFAKTMKGVGTIHLLPYHNLGSNKYELLGRDYLLEEIKPLKPEDMEEYQTMIESQGLKCIIGG